MGSRIWTVPAIRTKENGLKGGGSLIKTLVSTPPGGITYLDTGMLQDINVYVQNGKCPWTYNLKTLSPTPNLFVVLGILD